MPVEYRLLGPVEVRVDGHPVNLGGRKQKSVLATLALRVNEVVSVDRLMAAVWGEEGADRAPNTLHVYVYNLRRLLEPGAGKGVIESVAPGYVLRAAADDVDAVRFERLVAAARAQTDDPAVTSDRYREAAACWGGRALADLAAEPFAGAEIARLEALRVDAMEERIEIDLALGRHRDLIGELEALIAEHPWRERLRGQLMVALYRSGRQADALAAYADARRALVEDLGITPSTQLQDLERAVLTHDPSLDAPAPAGAARDAIVRRPAARPAVVRAASAFVGRREERDRVPELLRASPLVSLVGPGGVGKTRLALEVAAELRDVPVDEAVVVELAAITDPADVALRVADAAGLARVDGSAAGVASALHGRRALLVLDTCEHVLDGAAALVTEVLSRAPGCRVLTTTREALALPAELVWLVARLPAEDAARLFVERARAIDPSFPLAAGESPAVAELVGRLDGLPLAIELAAARVRTMSPEEISARLVGRLSLLGRAGRGGEPRHQTLRATLDWSHALLAPEEQAVFRQMAVFAGGFGLDAAEAVCRLPGAHDVVDVTDRLVAKSLVTSERHGAVTRFRLLESMREYAAERLADAGEERETAARHAGWFGGLAAENAAAMSARHSAATLSRLDRDRDNLLAALAFRIDGHDAAGALALADALVPYWTRRGRLAEARSWLARVVDATRSSPRPELVRAVAALASVELDLGDADGAAAHAADAVATAESLGLDRQARLARCLLGRAYQAQGRVDEAERLARDSLGDAERAGDAHGAAVAFRDLGSLARKRGDALGARAAFEQGLARFQQASGAGPDPGRLHDREQSAVIVELGVLAGEQGDVARAEHLLAESLALAEARGNVLGVVECLLALAAVAHQEGDTARVTELLDAMGAAERAADVALPPALAADRDELAAITRGA